MRPAERERKREKLLMGIVGLCFGLSFGALVTNAWPDAVLWWNLDPVVYRLSVEQVMIDRENRSFFYRDRFSSAAVLEVYQVGGWTNVRGSDLLNHEKTLFVRSANVDEEKLWRQLFDGVVAEVIQ